MTEINYLTELGFEELFRMHYKTLCNAANKILNDKHASEDIVQDVFFNFWKKKEELAFIQSVKNYLYRSTINASLNYLEKNKKTIQLKNTKVVRALTADDGGNSNHAELEIKIKEAINHLPPRCKVVFILSRYEGMKYQQIADHLGISIKTVENQMGKAFKILRAYLRPFLIQEFISISVAIGVTALVSYLSILLFIAFIH